MTRDCVSERAAEDTKRPISPSLCRGSPKHASGNGRLACRLFAFGFDCSGFTYIVHRANGVTIPRDTVSREELTPLYGKPVENYGDIRPGDLAYFAHQNGTGAVHHVGIYMGEGKTIHGPSPGGQVSIVDIVGSGWIDEYVGAIRYT